MTLDTRDFATKLRFLPRSEVEGYCKACGMDSRELSATLDYLYCHIKSDVIANRLGMSRSTFMRHKRILSIRLERYIRNNGIEF